MTLEEAIKNIEEEIALRKKHEAEMKTSSGISQMCTGLNEEWASLKRVYGYSFTEFMLIKIYNEIRPGFRVI